MPRDLKSQLMLLDPHPVKARRPARSPFSGAGDKSRMAVEFLGQMMVDFNRKKRWKFRTKLKFLE